MKNAATPSHVGDAHWGKGGRYQMVDGKRVPVTDPAPDSAVASAGHLRPDGLPVSPAPTFVTDTVKAPATQPTKKGK